MCPNNPAIFPWTCRCGKTFKTEVKLNNHDHSGRCTGPFTCDQCQAEFSSKNKLNNHKRTCGSEEDSGDEDVTGHVCEGDLMDSLGNN